LGSVDAPPVYVWGYVRTGILTQLQVVICGS
jgi:hypothetical protein